MRKYGFDKYKNIGNAVHRNRARRVIRAALRDLNPIFKRGYDIIFTARAKTTFVKMQVVKKDMQRHFELMGILNEKNCN